MAMLATNQFERHGSSRIITVFGTTGRAELGMSAKRGKFQSTTMSADIHCTIKRRGTAVNHLINAFYDDIMGMKSILNYLIIISENLL